MSDDHVKRIPHSNRWIGFDLDGTLAFHEYEPGSYDHTKVGKPIPQVVKLAKRYLERGHEIRIMTARVCDLPFLITPEFDLSPFEREMPESVACIRAIRSWCNLHLGQIVPITCMKDYHMIRLYDDRAVQVETNTGRIIG